MTKTKKKHYAQFGQPLYGSGVTFGLVHMLQVQHKLMHSIPHASYARFTDGNSY